MRRNCLVFRCRFMALEAVVVVKIAAMRDMRLMGARQIARKVAKTVAFGLQASFKAIARMAGVALLVCNPTVLSVKGSQGAAFRVSHVLHLPLMASPATVNVFCSFEGVVVGHPHCPQG